MTWLNIYLIVSCIWSAFWFTMWNKEDLQNLLFKFGFLLHTIASIVLAIQAIK